MELRPTTGRIKKKSSLHKFLLPSGLFVSDLEADQSEYGTLASTIMVYIGFISSVDVWYSLQRQRGRFELLAESENMSTRRTTATKYDETPGVLAWEFDP